MGVVIESPYQRGGSLWLRGNLHAHTTNSDGRNPPQAVVDAYAALGYDFLMISDHDYLTEPEPLSSRGMILLRGNEITANGPHVLHVGASFVVPPAADRQEAIDGVLTDGGIAIVAHPNWERDFNHCPHELLNRWSGYAGIEVYNGVVRRLDGNPLATDRWDRLLSAERRIWGFAHDDSHRDEDIGQAWIMTRSEDRTSEAITHSIACGAFYASTGVTVVDVSVGGATIYLETEDAQQIAVVADHGRRIAKSDGKSLSFTVPADLDASYVRFECWGWGECMAWTQPFFISRR
ncbi:MAG: hypothetical protein AMXMBFR84_28620 [Candidatus Hydrogenedentota bacterium]